MRPHVYLALRKYKLAFILHNIAIPHKFRVNKEVDGLDLQQFIREIPDFPKPGIMFKDITPILLDGAALREVIRKMAEFARNRQAEILVGPESRGFLFGAPLAYELGIGFVPVRKPGKLPGAVTKVEYELEYGTDSLEIHTDAIKPGQRVLIVDDLLATGGTSGAAARLLEQLGAQVVGMAFLIELSFLGAREKLNKYEIFSLLPY